MYMIHVEEVIDLKQMVIMAVSPDWNSLMLRFPFLTHGMREAVDSKGWYEGLTYVVTKEGCWDARL